jgi:hypothetical protein
MHNTVSVWTCPRCGQEFSFTGPRNPRRKCEACRKALRRERLQRNPPPPRHRPGPRGVFPNWGKLVRCVEAAADIYLPGRDYAANIVSADIKKGLVPASAFKQLPQRLGAGARG